MAEAQAKQDQLSYSFGRHACMADMQDCVTCNSNCRISNYMLDTTVPYAYRGLFIKPPTGNIKCGPLACFATAKYLLYFWSQYNAKLKMLWNDHNVKAVNKIHNSLCFARLASAPPFETHCIQRYTLRLNSL